MVASAVLVVTSIATFIAGASQAVAGTNGFATHGLFAFGGIQLAAATVTYSLTTSDLGYAVAQQAIRRAYLVLRVVGTGITAVAYFASLTALALAGIPRMPYSTTALVAALMLALAGRVNWWFVRDTVPALLPLGPYDSDKYHLLRPLLRWLGNAAILFAVLGLVATIFGAPQLVAITVIVAIGLALFSRLSADAGAIGVASRRLEQALAVSIVVLNDFGRNGNMGQRRRELQQALLELGGAASNNGSTRLADKMVRVDPVHLMMIGYLSRELGGLNASFGKSRDGSIRRRLADAGVADDYQLAKHAADYLEQLRRRLLSSSKQIRLEDS
jgi:hypothetical protein